MVRGQIGHKGGGGIVVQGVVHPGAEEVVGVVASGEADDAFKQIGTAQEHDGGVGGPHAATGGEWPPV